MYGRPSIVSMQPPMAQPISPSTPITTGVTISEASKNKQSGMTAIWVGMILLIIYLIYAWASKHEKIKSAVEPRNVAANAHNLFVIWLAALITIPISKIAAAKLVAFSKAHWASAIAKWIGMA